MDDVNVFYQNEDKWSIATEIYGQEEKQMEPNYYIMKLPGEESEEFHLFDSVYSKQQEEYDRSSYRPQRRR